MTEDVSIIGHIKGISGQWGVGELTAVVSKPFDQRHLGKVTFPVHGEWTTAGTLEGENLRAGLYALAQLEVEIEKAGFRLVYEGPYWFNRRYERP